MGCTVVRSSHEISIRKLIERFQALKNGCFKKILNTPSYDQVFPKIVHLDLQLWNIKKGAAKSAVVSNGMGIAKHYGSEIWNNINYYTPYNCSNSIDDVLLKNYDFIDHTVKMIAQRQNKVDELLRSLDPRYHKESILNQI